MSNSKPPKLCLKPESLNKLREAGSRPHRLATTTSKSTGTTAELEAIAARIAVFNSRLRQTRSHRPPPLLTTLPSYASSKNSQTRTSVIGICMGEAGLISRVLGLRFGAAFTFAAASAGEETASRPDCSPRPHRGLSHRGRRPLHQGLRRSRQPGLQILLATHDEHRLPPRNRQRRLPRAAHRRRHRPLSTSSAISPSRAFPSPCPTSRPSCRTSSTLTRSRPKSVPSTPFSASLSPGEKTQALRLQHRRPGHHRPSRESASPSRAPKYSFSAPAAQPAPPSSACETRGAEVSILNRTPGHRRQARQASRRQSAQAQSQLAKSSFDAIINATPVGMAGDDWRPDPHRRNDFEAGLKTRYVFDMVYNPVETPLLQARPPARPSPSSPA